MDAPLVRYASARDGSQIAYSVSGDGPPLVEVPHVQMSHLSAEWQIGAVRHWCEAVARSHALVRFDNRGGGLSRGGELDFSVEALSRDIETVADACRFEKFALFGRITGGLPAMAFAARHPNRVSHLILWNSFARNIDHGQAPRMKALLGLAATDWELFTESISQAALGWDDSDGARQWASVLREATTQSEFLTYLGARRSWDVSGLLEQIQSPTLVLVDRKNQLANEDRARELTTGIANARMLTVGSVAGMPDDEAISALERFVGVRATPHISQAAALTVREVEVLAQVETGASNSEIAEQLSISVNTVTRHLTHIYAKTGAKNRVQAIRYATERRLND